VNLLLVFVSPVTFEIKNALIGSTRGSIQLI